MNKNFEKVSRHIGWGDPDRGGLWFIGIEETLAWRQCDVDRLARLKNGEFTYDPVAADAEDQRAADRTRTRIPEWESKIACRLSANAVAKSMDWRAYRDECLWFDGQRVFSANLLPLGKTRIADWPEHYEGLFGFGPNDREAYFDAVRKIRYPALRAFWCQNSPAATIAFGKTYWKEFRAALELGDVVQHAKNDGVMYYERERVVLAPFFGYWHMRDQLVLDICKRLETWGISLP